VFLPLKDANPTSRFPFVTIALIVANVIVFLYEMSLGADLGRFIAAWGAIPYEITRGVDLVGTDNDIGLTHGQGPPLAFFTLFSSMFMHGGIFHIFGNMLYLWIFGNNVEDLLGPVKFLLFYLLCGVAAAATHIVMQPSSVVPMVGASGAVSGVLGAYLIAYPRARVLTLIFIVIFIRIVVLPASFLLIFWFIMQAFSGFASVASRGGGGVAWFAHIGGFVAGIALLFAMGSRQLARLRGAR
jgi:membrane associated rhomboid family serine protease